MMLTSHFSLKEFTDSDNAARLNIDNSPTTDQFENLNRLAAELEKVRSIFNVPITISSGFRCQKLNNATPGSSSKSQHMTGCAADIKIKGYLPKQIMRILIAHSHLLDINQLIQEYDSWVHFAIPEKGQTAKQQYLIIDHNGTRQYQQ